MSDFQKLVTSFQVGEWVYDKNSEQVKAIARATGVVVTEYGLAHPEVMAQWEVWVTFILDGEEMTASAKSTIFPTSNFIGGLLDKIMVARDLSGMSEEGKSKCLDILGKI